MDSLSKLRLDLDRALTRLTALEEMIFRVEPSQVEGALDTVEAIRIFLRKADAPGALSPAAANFIMERLPVDWRALAKQCGHQIVFPLLAQNYSIIDARRKLA